METLFDDVSLFITNLHESKTFVYIVGLLVVFSIGVLFERYRQGQLLCPEIRVVPVVTSLVYSLKEHCDQQLVIDLLISISLRDKRRGVRKAAIDTLCRAKEEGVILKHGDSKHGKGKHSNEVLIFAMLRQSAVEDSDEDVRYEAYWGLSEAFSADDNSHFDWINEKANCDSSKLIRDEFGRKPLII